MHLPPVALYPPFKTKTPPELMKCIDLTCLCSFLKKALDDTLVNSTFAVFIEAGFESTIDYMISSSRSPYPNSFLC